MFYSDNEYTQSIPVLPVMHLSHHIADPNSYVDANYKREEHEVAAHIGLGRAFNSLGRALVISRDKAYLIPELEMWKVRYEVRD